MLFCEKRESNPRKKQEINLREDHDSFRAENKKTIIATNLNLTKEKMSQMKRLETRLQDEQV